MRAASYPGSTDDNVALADHPLFDYKERVHINHEEDLHLLGKTLTLRPTMMTPISDTRPDTPEQYSQGLHLTARNVVECSVEGLLKACFRCLLVDRKQHYTPVTTERIVNVKIESCTRLTAEEAACEHQTTEIVALSELETSHNSEHSFNIKD